MLRSHQDPISSLHHLRPRNWSISPHVRVQKSNALHRPTCGKSTDNSPEVRRISENRPPWSRAMHPRLRTPQKEVARAPDFVRMRRITREQIVQHLVSDGLLVVLVPSHDDDFMGFGPPAPRHRSIHSPHLASTYLPQDRSLGRTPLVQRPNPESHDVSFATPTPADATVFPPSRDRAKH